MMFICVAVFFWINPTFFLSIILFNLFTVLFCLANNVPLFSLYGTVTNSSVLCPSGSSVSLIFVLIIVLSYYPSPPSPQVKIQGLRESTHMNTFAHFFPRVLDRNFLASGLTGLVGFNSALSKSYRYLNTVPVWYVQVPVTLSAVKDLSHLVFFPKNLGSRYFCGLA